MASRRIHEATRWFRQATHDLKAARWNSDGGFHDTACFLAQQSGEKALKSLLYYLGARRTALMTHSLVEMIQESEKHSAGAAACLDDARHLDLHYVPSRYPNGLPAGYPHQFYDKTMADRAMAAAQRMLDFVAGCYRARGEEEILAPDER